MVRRGKLNAVDLFCGAGGFTTGAVDSGAVDVRLAINHWRTAVFSHQANHPETKHLCARVDDVDPRHDKLVGPMPIDLLLASPECTHHSVARGGQPVDDQRRATPHHVPIWMEAKRPQFAIVENVREFRNWGPLIQKRDKKGRAVFRPDGQPWLVPDPARRGNIFRKWIQLIESLGYRVDHQLLNAADFGAATKRVRLFVIAQREDIAGDIPWPEPTHTEADWKPAASIIDWEIPCPSIFTRKRPLAEKTLRRIEIGLRKFVEPYLANLKGRSTVAGVNVPLGTMTARNGKGLVVPFLTKYYGTGGAVPVTRPLDTVTAKSRFGLTLVETMAELGVVDIGFRMLNASELKQAQGFPSGYELFGNKADQVRQVGNAVCPPVAAALCRTLNPSP